MAAAHLPMSDVVQRSYGTDSYGQVLTVSAHGSASIGNSDVELDPQRIGVQGYAAGGRLLVQLEPCRDLLQSLFSEHLALFRSRPRGSKKNKKMAGWGREAARSQW